MPTLTGTLTSVTGGTINASRVRNAYVRAPQNRGSLGSEGGLVTSVPVPVPTSGELSLDLEPGPALLVVDTLDAGQDVFDLYVTADMTLISEALAEAAPAHERSWAESQMVQLRAATVTAAGDAQTAKSAAEGAASVAEGHRTHVDSIRQTLDEAAQNNVAPYLTQTELNATYVHRPVAGAPGQVLVKGPGETTAWEDAPAGSPSYGLVGRVVPVSVDDPVPVLADGDVVVRYQPAGARYVTTFAADAVGSPPADWKLEWASVASVWPVTADPAATGGKVLRKATRTTNARWALTCPVVTTDPDVDVLAKWRTPSPEGGSLGLMTGLSGAMASGYGEYAHMMNATKLRIARFINGGSANEVVAVELATPIQADTWYCMRFRIRGQVQSVKLWRADETEPAAWNINYTTTYAVRSGAVGLYTAYLPQCDVDWFAVGTKQRTAVAP